MHVAKHILHLLSLIYTASCLFLARLGLAFCTHGRCLTVFVLLFFKTLASDPRPVCSFRICAMVLNVGPCTASCMHEDRPEGSRSTSASPRRALYKRIQIFCAKLYGSLSVTHNTYAGLGCWAYLSYASPELLLVLVVCWLVAEFRRCTHASHML